MKNNSSQTSADIKPQTNAEKYKLCENQREWSAKICEKTKNIKTRNMKKVVIFIALTLFCHIGTGIFAQTPQSFKYQTVVRNNEGKALANTMIGLRISILFSSPLGNAVYVETFQHATNEFGIASINIGKGTATQGVFAAINWAAGEYFIKTEVDITGATNYEFIGTSQLLSVPYALYAEKAGKSLNDQDTSATNELQTITKTGNTITLSQNGGSVTDSDNQTLNLTGFNLSISDGNTIQLPFDVDHDTLNEIQLITKSGNVITLSKNGGSVTDSDNQSLSIANNQLTISNGNTVNIDQDTLNEIQTISKVGNVVTLSKNGGSFIDSDNQSLTLINGTKLAISNGDTVTLPAGIAAQNLLLSHDTLKITSGNSIILPDADSTNEIQQLQLTHNTLHLTKANTITIDADTTNELQYLSFNNDTLYLSKGNYVKLNFYQILPNNTCFQSTSSVPPVGFTYQSTQILSVSDEQDSIIVPPTYTNFTTAAVVNDKIYLFNQLNTKAYNILSDTWEDKSPNTLVTNGQYPMSAAYGDKIYLLSNYPTTQLYEYNTTTDTWSAKQAPSWTFLTNCASIGDCIYYMGWSSGLYIAKYNILNDTWIQPFNTGGGNYTRMCAVSNDLYCFGNATFRKLNILTNQWSSELPASSCYDCPAIGLNDRIYLLNVGSTNEEFDPFLQRWLPKKNLLYQTGTGILVSYKDKIFIIQGNNPPKMETYKPYNLIYTHCK